MKRSNAKTPTFGDERGGPIPPPDLSDWKFAKHPPLRGQVAVVAGGTRGAGRAIAVALGVAGATVYVTGRSVPGRPATPGRPETILGTVGMIRDLGGKATPVRVDHTDESQVRSLFQRVRREQRGRLDILVNDIWGGEELVEWGKPPWELSWAKGRTMLERGIHTHILTSRYGVPLMVRRKRGLVVEITDGDHLQYRGSLFYDLVKTSVIRLALALDEEFDEAHLPNLTAIAVTPGFLRSEFMLDQFGVSEAHWREGGKGHRHWKASESPYYLGKAVAALAADPKVHRRSGKAVGTWDLARAYRFTDLDGTQPDWGKVFSEEP
jgi:NAD(P)-dependent dehydrogenase (short-subunit alcohol dehydrogenase family)